MPSTVIRDHHYRPESRKLLINFQTGRRYVYFDVPPAAVEAMRSAMSKGRYFNAHIRDRYRFRELTPS
ncbi:MAG: KTSC domain-containing protein [Sphingomicrobium sp.]